MNAEELIRDAVLRVGEVVAVRGRTVTVEVDKKKNQTDLMFNGEIVKNISVDSYVEIRKGFLSLIGKVDGEEIKEEPARYKDDKDESAIKIRRLLSVSLVGFIDSDDRFEGGTKELPLIGNEAFVVSAEKIKTIHKLVEEGELSITIAETDDGVDIPFPIDGLFNGHIAIFGNTGSGKSNTLAHLCQELVRIMKKESSSFTTLNRFLLLDFNGEFGEESITTEKVVYRLSTRNQKGDKLPAKVVDLNDLEVLSVLANATDKTQKPFLKRALRLHELITSKSKPEDYARGILKNQAIKIFGLADKSKSDDLLDYMRQILPGRQNESGYEVDILDKLEWHYKESRGYRFEGTYDYLAGNEEVIMTTELCQRISGFHLSEVMFDRLIHIIYIKLIDDVLTNRAQNEHIAPAINRLKSVQSEMEKIIDRSSTKESVFDSNTNFVVINLHDVNIEMKKAIPLMLCKRVYQLHKYDKCERSLNLIIDEAHQILSNESSREAESWKEYRLETFEEIIKEGRKFGVFVTISSQRPHDISPTITSQAHNYFIHRLINQRDLDSVANAVSYIDRLSQESIPSLPTGTCIFSGVASMRPLKVHIKELPDPLKPKSKTLTFAELVTKPKSVDCKACAETKPTNSSAKT